MQAAVDPIRLASDRNVPKQAICEETVQVCVQRYGTKLLAIVLTGSLARDEATFAKQHDGWKPLSDADFLLIVRDRKPIPSPSALDAAVEEIRSGLARRGLPCCVSVGAVHPRFLERLQPHIFAYELKTSGQVIWGDSLILLNIPAFSPSDIPLEDAWRLLCNRMVEQLDLVDELAERPAALSERVQYQVVKLYLDMATSILLFVGAYAGTYRERADRLSALASSPQSESAFPFALEPFAEKVEACTRAKLTGVLPASMGSPSFWEEALAYAQLLWRWELGRLTGVSHQLPSRDLLMRAMHRQTWIVRLRGWLVVVRKQGWHRSVRHWFRWARLGRRASPRYWVYLASGELLFRLPCLLNGRIDPARISAKWESLRECLPHHDDASWKTEDPMAWQHLARGIVWNYHAFLEGTRA